MCERGRALSVFATIHLLLFSCLRTLLYDIYIAKTIVISKRNIANRPMSVTMYITEADLVLWRAAEDREEPICIRKKALRQVK